ncbi:cornifelin homolog A-like [Mugil cephalus]|uniref:cornifelin homolog A-like n=1 Tax=Mugil cephalus TaxID=48193 RepID=UPI001FB607BB|nr:cornifelin homolog A-like [Mugil cephalus]
MAAKSDRIEWTSGLCDCFEDASTCCYGFWCCPCLACTVSGRFGENYCLPLCDVASAWTGTLYGFPLCVPPAVLSMRASMRNRYGIKGSLCKDIAVACFCQLCAWCQMHRELKNREKAPTVINMQHQTVYNMQPPPVVVMNTNPPAPGFVTHSVVVTQQ